MRTQLKRLLSVALTVLMVFSMISLVFAAPSNVAKIGSKEYRTFDAALKAANDGDTITLITDVNVPKNFKIEKNITLDGNGNKISGELKITGAATVKIEKVNFVNGSIFAEEKPKSKPSLTVSDCTFAVKDKGEFAIKVGNIEALTLENVKIDGYKNGISVNVKKNTTVDFLINNCEINASNPISIDKKNDTEQIFVLVGDNDFSNLKNIEYATYMLTEGATLKAPEGLPVVTDVEDCEIAYVNGVYIIESSIVYVAMIGETGYESILDAVAAAKDGDVITVIADTTIASDEAVVSEVYKEYNYMTYIEILDKNITIDFNGKKVTINPEFDGTMLAAIFVGETGALTLKDSSDAQTGGLYVNAAENVFTHSFLFVDQTEARLYIESGNYYINRVDYQSMLYVAHTGTGYISGGNFTFDNVPADANAQPWMFNTYGNSVNYVEVTGGTYNAYPQNRRGEVKIPDCYKIVANDDDTYSVVYVPVVMIGDIGYKSISDAVAAAKDGDVITVVADHEITSSEFVASAVYEEFDSYVEILDKAVTIDFNGKKVTANPELEKIMSSIFYVGETGSLVLKDSSEAQNGGLAVTMGENTQAYSLIFADGAQSKLTIESGDYYIDKVEYGYSMVYVAQTGTGYVNGGNFVLGNAYSYEKQDAMIPWIFNTYGNGMNFVDVKGGTYNVNPQNRWNEVKFPKGYAAYEDIDGIWKVTSGPIIVKQPTDITIGYNKVAHFTPVIAGDNLTYTWYYSDNGGKYFYKSTLTTATYDINGIVSRDGRQIYCVATDINGKSVTTDIVTLTVVPNEELAIVSQPTVVEGTLNNKVSVVLDVTGDDLTYVWYYSDNGGKSFYKSTLTTETYDIILKEERMGRVVYCEITDAFGKTIKSENITINAVKSVELMLNSAPAYEAVAVGETAKITLDVQGEGLKYTWYYSNPGQSAFYKSTITDSVYSLTLTDARVGRRVYCVITDAFGNEIQTETVTLAAK